MKIAWPHIAVFKTFDIIMMIHYLVVGIVQPMDDFHTVTHNDSASPVQLMCSLNIDITSNMTVTWSHNGSVVMTAPTQTGNTTTLQIENPQPSDAGVYQCVFKNTYYQWIRNRNITLELCKYLYDYRAT